MKEMEKHLFSEMVHCEDTLFLLKNELNVAQKLGNQKQVSELEGAISRTKNQIKAYQARMAFS